MYKHEHLNVPIELIKYAHLNRMHKALGIYLILKASCNGHLKITKEIIGNCMNALGIKDNRSFNKYFKKLLSENWVGHDIKTGIYYVRGSAQIKKLYKGKENLSVVFNIKKDCLHIREFIFAALLSHEVRRREKGRKAKIIKLAGKSALKKESAVQDLASSNLISEYIGLSLSTIARLLNVKQSQADRIKKKLVSLGYIKTKAHFKTVCVLGNVDFNLPKYLPSNRRYAFKQKNGIYEITERSFDEITTFMEFRHPRTSANRFGRLVRKNR